MNKIDTLQTMYASRPLVFGHRGASAYAPENTLPAFQRAAELNAHGVELDVQLTSDGVPVVIHNFTVEKTTNGSGAVAEMTLDQLKSLDAGAWFDPEFAGTRIPTLPEVFDAVGNDLYINVELKTESVESDGLEEAVATSIRTHQMGERVLISSFNPLALIRFRKIAPEIPLGFLYSPDTLGFLAEGIAEFTYDAIHPQFAMIDEHHIRQAREANYYINTWTVNNPEKAVELLNLGVDLFISDKPDVILRALAG